MILLHFKISDDSIAFEVLQPFFVSGDKTASKPEWPTTVAQQWSSGTVFNSDSLSCEKSSAGETLAAFSHFTYERS
jgi:hypothetical protein